MTFIQNNPLSRRKSSPCNQNDDKTISEVREEAGSSNAGKYPNVPKDEFCGPAGGAAAGTYPVNTAERIASAKKLAEHAPNPDGIIACANKAGGEEKGHLSRRSSSPLNQNDERSGHTFLDKVKGTAQNIGSYLSDVPGKLRQKNIGFMDTDYDLESPGGFHSSGKGRGQFKSKKDAEAYRLARSAQERKDRVSAGAAFFRKSSSPVNYSGLAGVNESDWLKYGGDVIDETAQKHEGVSRHGSMTGDQSAKSDYANFKDTDPNYHGHDGESHKDQSATRRDYMGNMGRHHIDPRTKK